jgi:hypothetical protein
MGADAPLIRLITTERTLRVDAERLAHIIMEMQRCFILRLSRTGSGECFVPAVLPPDLSRSQGGLTMSAIAQKMGHTTAAASGLVARLENLGYVMRSHASDDRRKVMVCITPRGSALVRRIREEMDLQPDEDDGAPVTE